MNSNRLLHSLILPAFLFGFVSHADDEIPADPLPKGSPAVCSLITLSAAKEYPRGIHPKKNPDLHFTYGFEVEYAIDELQPALLEDYAPTVEVLPRETWAQFTPEQKKEWVKVNQSALFPQGTRKPGNLVRIVDDPELPERLIIDETGNLEMIGTKIFADRMAFWRFMDKINQRFGRGYVQASIGIPAKAVHATEKSTGEYLGKLLFMGQRDTLQKLHQAYAKHLSTPAYVPAKSFTHPFLGPMTESKANFLRNVMYRNRVGKASNDLLDRISATDASYKYTSQVVYRPDIVRSQKVFLAEVRDCVTDFDCLKRRLLREVYFHSSDLRPFRPFEDLRVLDPVADFNLFSGDVLEMFEAALPRKLRRFDEAEILATDVARNFAFPLQDWSGLYEGMGHPTSSQAYETLKRAQAAFEVEAASIGSAYKRGEINGETAINRIRISVARFVHEAGILSTMDEFLKKRFPGYAELEPYF